MAANSVVELDPVFLKAIKLLHSRHPDSQSQLKALRDEAIRQHNQPVPQSTREKGKEAKPSGPLERRPSTITSVNESKAITRAKEPKIQTLEGSSCKIEHMKDIHTEGTSIEMVEELGSGLIETVEEFSSTSLLVGHIAKKAKLQISVDKVLDESSEVMPVEDLTIDLGIACVVCYGHENKSVGNKLVECHECHSHFHQKCHEPRVSDQDVNDPRLVWYCSQCIRKMREITTSTTPKTRPVEGSASTGRSHRPSQLQPFRRLPSTDTKSFASPTTPQSFAIPALAGSSSSKSPVPGTSTQKSSMQSAMKRLQMVKKKAAQKILNHQQIRVPRR